MGASPAPGEDEQHTQALVLSESERLRGRFVSVVDDADQEVPLAQRGLVCRRPRHLPRHAGECGGQVVLLLSRAGQLDAERALGAGRHERAEDFLAQQLFGDAYADLRDARRLLTLLDVMAQVVPQVEQALLAGNDDGLEIRLPVGELGAVRIDQPEFRRAVRIVGGDDEVEVGRHGDERI
ncbi:MAG: hypothetical protein ACR2M4_02855 [Actinomycetota bacterium]